MSSVSRTITIDAMDINEVQDIQVYRGSYLQIDYTVQNAAESAVNIASATIRFTAWDIEAEANEFQLSTAQASEVLITDGAAGEFTVYLTDDETDTDPKTYRYSIHIILSGGTEHHAVEGKLRLLFSDYTGP